MAFPTNSSIHTPTPLSIDPGLVCVKEKAMIALQRKCNENFHNNNFSRFIFCMQKLLFVKQSTVVKIYFSQIFPRFFPDFPEQRDQKKVVFHGVANSESALQSRLVLSHLRQAWEHRPLQYLQTFQT